jgi:hypothetical protein
MLYTMSDGKQRLNLVNYQGYIAELQQTLVSTTLLHFNASVWQVFIKNDEQGRVSKGPRNHM